MSLDDVTTQAKFAKQESYPFRLLSDTDASVTRKFDVMHESGRFSDRVTILVNPEGKIHRIERPTDLARHGKDLIAWAKE